MSYDKIEYWNSRNDPNNDFCRSHTSNHIKITRPFIGKNQNILEYGPGVGRMLELYKEGIVAHIQIHDELDVSVESEKHAKKIVEIMDLYLLCRRLLLLLLILFCCECLNIFWKKSFSEKSRCYFEFVEIIAKFWNTNLLFYAFIVLLSK